MISGSQDRAIVTIEGQWEVLSALSNCDISNDLDGPLTRFSRSQHFWSRISEKQCVFGTKLLENNNRKSDGGSIRVGSNDLEWPWKVDVRNQCLQFRRILITLVRSATSLHLHKYVARFLSHSWVSCSWCALSAYRAMCKMIQHCWLSLALLAY